MEKHLFNLKFAAKELERNARKCEKDEKVEKTKIKKAVQKGDMESARIHAENAVRKKNEALNYMRMGSRIDAVSARVQTAVTTKKVTQSLAGVVKAMDAALASMNLEKVSNLMDRFEKDFENLDVQSASMDSAMSNTTTLTAPQGEIDKLMMQAADEAGIELNLELPAGQTSTVGVSTTASAEQVMLNYVTSEDELTQRLAKLRQT